MTALLETTRLAVAAGGRTVVRGLDLRVQPGEVWAVVGPNGAGKTLLLRTLAGLRAPQSGEVRLGGSALPALAPVQAARRRAFLPQSLHDAFGARVLDVVMLGRHAHLSRWAWEGEDDVDRAMAALRAVQAAHLADRDVTTLSGGERQRVAIAALLGQESPLLLLDEPVAHVDLQHQLAVLAHLASVAAHGRAVVFSVHDLNLAARFATHAMLYRGGGEVECGPAARVLEPAALSQAFGHPIARHRVDGRDLFAAA